MCGLFVDGYANGVFFFVLLVVDAVAGDGCRIWEHLHSWNVSWYVPRRLGWVYMMDVELESTCTVEMSPDMSQEV